MASCAGINIHFHEKIVISILQRILPSNPSGFLTTPTQEISCLISTKPYPQSHFQHGENLVSVLALLALSTQITSDQHVWTSPWMSTDVSRGVYREHVLIPAFDTQCQFLWSCFIWLLTKLTSHSENKNTLYFFRNENGNFVSFCSSLYCRRQHGFTHSVYFTIV